MAVVTGGNSGIGLAAAKRLQQEGASVAIWADVAKLAELDKLYSEVSEKRNNEREGVGLLRADSKNRTRARMSISLLFVRLNSRAGKTSWNALERSRRKKESGAIAGASGRSISTGALNSKGELMRINFGEVLKIEDLGNHPPLTVIRLGLLLAGTVNVTPDPKRKNFYEVEDARTVYYIYVSPVTGTISLIAAWRNIVQPGPHVDVAAAAAAS